MGVKVIVAYKDDRTTIFLNAKMDYDLKCGTYNIEKEDGGTIYVPRSFIEKIKVEKEAINAGN